MPITFPTKPGIIAYLTAGDPDLATTRDIALAAIDSGAGPLPRTHIILGAVYG